MKKMLRSTLSFVLFALATSAAFSQDKTAVIDTSGLPTNLVGRWYTPDWQYSQVLKIHDINYTSGTAKVSRYSDTLGCTVEKASAVVKVLGTEKFNVRVTDTMSCVQVLDMDIWKKNGKYEGKAKYQAQGSPFNSLDLEF